METGVKRGKSEIQVAGDQMGEEEREEEWKQDWRENEEEKCAKMKWERKEGNEKWKKKRGIFESFCRNL